MPGKTLDELPEQFDGRSPVEVEVLEDDLGGEIVDGQGQRCSSRHALQLERDDGMIPCFVDQARQRAEMRVLQSLPGIEALYCPDVPERRMMESGDEDRPAHLPVGENVEAHLRLAHPLAHGVGIRQRMPDSLARGIDDDGLSDLLH